MFYNKLFSRDCWLNLLWNAQLWLGHAATALHESEKPEPSLPRMLFQYMPLPAALTVQAAVVVLPVCTHSILFTNKHHFGHTHPDQASSLQGTAHTEQLLQIKGAWVWVTVAALCIFSETLKLIFLQTVEFTHNYVLFSNPGMQVVHCYFGPL